jgi:uncharacterized Ntn-hydrolase superfamily protein
MTFSIAGRCAQTGAFGVAITTSSIAVGARCPHARSGVGAVVTQNVTDPALGPLLLDYLHDGMNAQEAIGAVTRNRKHIAYRQLTVVDRFGKAASYTGQNVLGQHGVSEARGCVAAGNLLKTPDILKVMTDRFVESEGVLLAERLIRSLEDGLAAGGEEGPVHSAALLVYTDQSYPTVNLRVDWSESDPVGDLRKLWTAYAPQVDAYLQRASDPSEAPRYGVPGDP